MPNKKLEEIRENIKQKKARRRSKKRKQKAKKAGRNFAKKKRIERNAPKNKTEKALATVRQTKLLASELGVSEANAKRLQERASDVLESASAQGGGALAALDIDGDGDTDILQTMETEVDIATSTGIVDKVDAATVDPGEDGFREIDVTKPVNIGLSGDMTDAKTEKDLLGL